MLGRFCTPTSPTLNPPLASCSFLSCFDCTNCRKLSWSSILISQGEDDGGCLVLESFISYLFDGPSHNIAHDSHGLVLVDPEHAADSLLFHSGIPLRLHDVDAICDRKTVKTIFAIASVNMCMFASCLADISPNTAG